MAKKNLFLTLVFQLRSNSFGGQKCLAMNQIPDMSIYFSVILSVNYLSTLYKSSFKASFLFTLYDDVG